MVSFNPLSSFLTPPSGQVVIVSKGVYYFAHFPAVGNPSYTKVPAVQIVNAKSAQMADYAAQLQSAQLSDAASGVILGLAAANIIQAVEGDLLTLSLFGQPVAVYKKLNGAAPSGYLPTNPNAPYSVNLPILEVTADGIGNNFTGRVIAPGASAPGNVPVPPVEPDTQLP